MELSEKTYGRLSWQEAMGVRTEEFIRQVLGCEKSK